MTYKKLFESLTFNNGVSVASRLAMAPMVVLGSDDDGFVGEDDVRYFQRRADTASLLITGATSVGDYSNAFGQGLGAFCDEQVEGLGRLAEAMKSKGNRAVLQIYHSGREAKYTYRDKGKVYGPSAIDFSFLDYPVTALTTEEVEVIIEQFGQATRRALEAGFDGVEIHGANHYLIQQFFSKLSNQRTDKYGGSLEGRANFALEIVKRVKEVVAEAGRTDFIIGYRISPEEIHGEDIGYDLEESLYLIDQVAALGVDYVHSFQWGEYAYKARSRHGRYLGEVINHKIHQTLKGRAKLLAAGDIMSPDKALEALDYADLVALGSMALIEPDFKNKIQSGQIDRIELDVRHKYADLALPARFPRMASVINRTSGISQETIDFIRQQ